jgi:hypothetical protein
MYMHKSFILRITYTLNAWHLALTVSIFLLQEIDGLCTQRHASLMTMHTGSL